MRLRRSLQAPAGQRQTPDAFDHSYDENMRTLKKILANDDLIIFRSLTLDGQDNHRCCAVYVDGMVDSDLIHENVLARLQDFHWQQTPEDELLSLFVKRIVSAGNVTTETKVNPAIQALLYGNVLLVVDGASAVILIEAKGWEKRAISEPETERVVRGPREGFIENIVTNLVMIRRKVTNPNLKMVYREIGTRTKTKICIVYLEGVSRKEFLDELQRRLDQVQMDGILEPEYIIELIRDAPLSPFETLGTTERPDTAVGKLLEGRILVVVDGSPFVITLPYLFVEYFQANKDYYDNYFYSSVNRLLRYLSFFLTTSTPAIFVALTTFHQEMIPTRLLFSISAAKEGVPFPTVVEALLMLTAFQILREAGVRLPSPVGQAVSIVGALILGEAAVTAKIISAPMVIVAALTGITSFMVPEMPGVAFLLSIFFLLASSFLGFFGYIFAVIALTIHLAGIRSFGVTYLASITSIRLQDLKDTAIRAPWWWMTYRPRLLTHNDRRLADPGRPKP
ncbi:spore germination protein [Heliobacterium undosum]|uniref:Spore germination protein n=1 Tax=Heliomicrobium undosum TaxID=121734 RepID=A0A845L1Y8_9FIRM|nr:spore germination protein [Heliomicrobium undosum]